MAGVAATQAVRQNGEAGRKFDVFVNDVVRQVEPNRRVIPNGANADFDEFVGDRLRGARRDGNDAHLDRAALTANFGGAFGDLVERVNDATVDRLAEKRRVRVERRGDVESVFDEAFVIEDGASEVAGADEKRRRFNVPTEKPFDRFDQFVDAVPDFRASGDAGDREVFAHLNAQLAEFFGDARARNDVVAASPRFF